MNTRLALQVPGECIRGHRGPRGACPLLVALLVGATASACRDPNSDGPTALCSGSGAEVEGRFDPPFAIHVRRTFDFGDHLVAETDSGLWAGRPTFERVPAPEALKNVVASAAAGAVLYASFANGPEARRVWRTDALDTSLVWKACGELPGSGVVLDLAGNDSVLLVSAWESRGGADGTGTLFRSTDGCSSWTSVLSVGNRQLSSIRAARRSGAWTATATAIGGQAAVYIGTADASAWREILAEPTYIEVVESGVDQLLVSSHPNLFFLTISTGARTAIPKLVPIGVDALFASQSGRLLVGGNLGFDPEQGLFVAAVGEVANSQLVPLWKGAGPWAVTELTEAEGSIRIASDGLFTLAAGVLSFASARSGRPLEVALTCAGVTELWSVSPSGRFLTPALVRSAGNLEAWSPLQRGFRFAGADYVAGPFRTSDGRRLWAMEVEQGLPGSNATRGTLKLVEEDEAGSFRDRLSIEHGLDYQGSGDEPGVQWPAAAIATARNVTYLPIVGPESPGVVRLSPSEARILEFPDGTQGFVSLAVDPCDVDHVAIAVLLGEGQVGVFDQRGGAGWKRIGDPRPSPDSPFQPSLGLAILDDGAVAMLLASGELLVSSGSAPLTGKYVSLVMGLTAAGRARLLVADSSSVRSWSVDEGERLLGAGIDAAPFRVFAYKNAWALEGADGTVIFGQ